MEAQARYTPHRRTHRHRACREGSWEGGGSLVAAGDSVVPWGGDAACHDGNCTMVWCNNLYFRWCGVIFTVGKKRIMILAPQWHGVVLPPCHCGPESSACGTNVTHSMPRGGDIGQFWMRRRWTKSSEEGRSWRSVCHPSRGDFRSLRTSFGKKHVELLLGMYDS